MADLIRRFPILFALLLLLPVPGAGQEPGAAGPGAEELVDRVVAIVGDSVVLHTQVHEELLRRQAQGMQVPAPGSSQRVVWEREALTDLVNQLLLLQAAARDTLVSVSDDRIETTLRQTWDSQVAAFGSEANMRAAAEAEGRSLVQYRAELRDDIRRSLLIQGFLQRRAPEVRTLPIEESEIREFFELERERLGDRPATLSFRQAFVMPRPSDEAMATARAEAERIRELILGGEDFAELARRFSGDSGSRQLGGDLGWFRLSSGLVQEFEDAAFSIRPGVISPVVETIYGAHIIKVERVRGAERKIHHILISAEVTAADAERARTQAEEVRERVRAGEPFSGFTQDQRRMDIPDSVYIETDRLQQYPDAFATALRSAAPGDLLGPVPFPTQQGDAYVVIRMLDVRSAGGYSYEDVRDFIRENIQSERIRERILSDLRDRTYVEIRL